MGSLYRPKYRAADGTLKESAVIWLKYRDALGVLRRESSETTKEQEARRVLRRKEGAAEDGRIERPHANRVTIAQLAEDLKADYTANGRRSLDRVELSLAHLLPFFGPMRALQVESDVITKYVVQRQGDGAANATVNRELAALKRMYSLGQMSKKIKHRPYIP